MKVCEICHCEIDGKDGVDNRCPEHENTVRVAKKARRRRSIIAEVMADHGMTKVRGNLGGTYYE